jgi:hypothetical protein
LLHLSRCKGNVWEKDLETLVNTIIVNSSISIFRFFFSSKKLTWGISLQKSEKFRVLLLPLNLRHFFLPLEMSHYEIIVLWGYVIKEQCSVIVSRCCHLNFQRDILVNGDRKASQASWEQKIPTLFRKSIVVGVYTMTN